MIELGIPAKTASRWRLEENPINLTEFPSSASSSATLDQTGKVPL